MEGNVLVSFRNPEKPDLPPVRVWARRWDGQRFLTQGATLDDGSVLTDWNSRYEFRIESLPNDMLTWHFKDEDDISCTIVGSIQHPKYPQRKLWVFVRRIQGGPQGLRKRSIGDL